MPIKEPKKPLLKAEDVKWVRFRKRLEINNNDLPIIMPVRIGGWANGNIYVGDIKFRNGVRQRVAIKRFKHERASRLNLEQFQKKINDLRNAGVSLPKMAMYLLPAGTKIGNKILPIEEWVLISELFAKRNSNGNLESKIENKSWFRFKTDKQKIMALIELTKVANAGYHPSSDFIEPFKNSERIIPIDLDLITPSPPEERAMDMYQNIKRLFDTISERNEAFQIIYDYSNLEMKTALTNMHNYGRHLLFDSKA